MSFSLASKRSKNIFYINRYITVKFEAKPSIVMDNIS